MNRTLIMRMALWIGAFFNFGAALMFIFPVSLGQIAGLPASGSLFYNLSMRMLHAIPALPVKDMERSVEFYRNKLGFTLIHPLGILHTKGEITDTPWATREFAVVDPDNNLITFYEDL